MEHLIQSTIGEIMLKKISRKRAVKFANDLGFDVVDLAIVDGVECVGKRGTEGVVYWPLEKEGSGFEQLFKGFSRWIE